MERLKLTVEARELTGKKVKRLRKEGILPANIFGKDMTSVSIQMEIKEFKTLFKAAGETSLIDVKIGDKVFPSLINHIQRDPVHDQITHVDFHKVNLKEKITAAVPVILEGESPAVKAGIGLLLQTLNEIEVESLPTDIPQSIVIDAEKLTEVGQSIHVKNLKIDKDKVEIKNDPEELVITVQNAEMKEEKAPEAEASPADVEAVAEKGDAEESAEGGEEKQASKEDKSEG